MQVYIRYSGFRGATHLRCHHSNGNAADASSVLGRQTILLHRRKRCLQMMYVCTRHPQRPTALTWGAGPGRRRKGAIIAPPSKRVTMWATVRAPLSAASSARLWWCVAKRALQVTHLDTRPIKSCTRVAPTLVLGLRALSP